MFRTSVEEFGGRRGTPRIAPQPAAGHQSRDPAKAQDVDFAQN
jgi:hypothetical protein